MSKLDAYVAKVKQDADDSDFKNLAHAVLQVDTEIAYLQDLRTRILAAAELPKEKRPVEVIKALFDEAYGHKGRPRV